MSIANEITREVVFTDYECAEVCVYANSFGRATTKRRAG